MSRNAHWRLILGAVIAGLCGWYGVAHLLRTTGPSTAQAASPALPSVDQSSGQPHTQASSRAATLEREQRLIASTPWPHDPFFRLTALDAQEESDQEAQHGGDEAIFVLNAVISGPPPLAMINGSVVAVGARLLDGSTVTAIDAHGVTLRGPQGPWTLVLSE